MGSRFFVLLALLASLASSAQATTVVRLDFDELSRSSTVVLHGTVISTESRWTDDRSMIVTEVTISVHETLKGEDLPAVRFIQPGGVVDGIRVSAHGVAAYRPGDEAVLFLAPASGSRLAVNGLSQGHFPVEMDPGGDKRITGLPPELQRTGKPERLTAPSASRPLGEGLDALRSHFAREGGDR